jgi:hypothetical protein
MPVKYPFLSEKVIFYRKKFKNDTNDPEYESELILIIDNHQIVL